MDIKELRRLAFDGDFFAILELLDRLETASTIPEGWKLVPINPVQEMSEAGVYAGGIYYDIVDAVYEAMVNIAPEYKP